MATSLFIVDSVYNNKYDMPSLDVQSPVFIGRLVVDKTVKPYTGTYTFADGNTMMMENGKTEEEIMAQAEAELEAQMEAEERKQAAQRASAAKIADAKKQLASVQNGNTYYFNSVYTPYNRQWQQQHQNASVRFLSNGQKVIVSIAGSTNYLNIREITSDGEISCYETGNPLYGSWYIRIMTIDGKKAFKILRPLGQLEYLLKNPYKVGR